MLPSKRIKDRTGEKVGSTGYVKEFAGLNDFNQAQWKIVCSCGQEFIVNAHVLNRGLESCKHCSFKRKNKKLIKDLTGKIFDTGTKVIEMVDHKDGDVYWLVNCAKCNKNYTETSHWLANPQYPGICRDCVKIDLKGYQFGFGCEVIKEVEKLPNNPHRRWLVKCGCGKEFETQQTHILYSGIQSCQSCAYIRQGITTSGENHWNYDPELTDEERANKRDICNKWKKQVLAKYNNQCIISGWTDNLDCHHIYNYKDHPELRCNVDNGVSIHRDLHILFHKTYGQRYNNKTQFEEFVYNVKYL